MRFVAAPLLVVLVTSSSRAWDDKPTPKLPLGKDTTVVDGPLDKDGYIDYEAVLDARLGKGVSPEKNAVARLWAAVGPESLGDLGPAYFARLGIQPLPEKGNYYIEVETFLHENLRLQDTNIPDIYFEQLSQSFYRPWSASEFPRLTAWLRANEKPLSIIAEAVKRPLYFDPPVQGFFVLSGNSLLFSRPARALSSRALQRAGDGNFDAAWDDILTCHRLARHIACGFDMQQVEDAQFVHDRACYTTIAYLEAADPSSRRTMELLTELKKLPPFTEMAEKIDIGERFQYQCEVKKVRRGDQSWTARESVLSAVDWAVALRAGNERCDRAVAAAKLTNRMERRNRFKVFQIEDWISRFRKLPTFRDVAKELQKTLESPGATNADKTKAGEKAGIIIADLVRADFRSTDDFDLIEQNLNNLTLAFALHAFKKDTGKYPSKLADIAPKYLPTIPDDLFSGKPLVYKPSDTGYLLYSVGVNGKDDGGRSYGDEPKGDDVVVRMPLPKQ